MKLIFSKVEDISKTATFPEKNFIIVIFHGLCHYLNMIKMLRAL